MTKSAICVALVLFSSSMLCAQSASIVPDAPSVAKASTTTAQAVPLGFDGKARYFAQRMFSPWNIVTPAFGAGLGMATADSRLPREWRQGAGAFGRLYGTEIAALATFNTTKFLTGLALREDPRYFR